MPWKQLTEDTYYYPGTTNVGYHKGVIIDSGESVQEAEQMALELIEMGLEIKWLLNTHCHPDHCGGNAAFVNHGAKLVAFDFQMGFMMDLELASHFMYGAQVLFGEQRRFKFPAALPVYPDEIMRPGVINLDGAEFVVERHIGHALDQITVCTEDDVLFIGDILLPMGMARRSAAQTLFSAAEQLKDLDWLMNSKHAVFVPGHGRTFSSASALVKENIRLQNTYLNEIYAFCEEPKTRETIAAYLIQKFKLADTMSGTSIVSNTAGAYLMLLESRRKMTVYNESGYTYYKSMTHEA